MIKLIHFKQRPMNAKNYLKNIKNSFKGRIQQSYLHRKKRVKTISKTLGTGRKNDGMRPNLLKIPEMFTYYHAYSPGIGLNRKFGYYFCSYRKCLQNTIFFFCNVPNKTPYRCNEVWVSESAVVYEPTIPTTCTDNWQLSPLFIWTDLEIALYTQPADGQQRYYIVIEKH